MKFYFYEVNRVVIDRRGIVELETLFRSENLGDAIFRFKKICEDEKRTFKDWIIKLTDVRVILSRFEIEIEYNSIKSECEVENVTEIEEILVEDVKID